jgi:hypothetical protein
MILGDELLISKVVLSQELATAERPIKCHTKAIHSMVRYLLLHAIFGIGDEKMALNVVRYLERDARGCCNHPLHQADETTYTIANGSIHTQRRKLPKMEATMLLWR